MSFLASSRCKPPMLMLQYDRPGGIWGSLLTLIEFSSCTSLGSLDLKTQALKSCHAWLEEKGSSLGLEASVPSPPCSTLWLSSPFWVSDSSLQDACVSVKPSYGQQQSPLQTFVQLLKTSKGWARAGPCFKPHAQLPVCPSHYTPEAALAFSGIPGLQIASHSVHGFVQIREE